MATKVRLRIVLALLVFGLLGSSLWSVQAEDKAPPEKQTLQTPSATAVEPAPLSDNVQRGLKFLVEQHDASGGWGQGGGWRTSDKGRVEGQEVKDPPDVGNTCVAALALVRSGSTPKQGPYASHVQRAATFIIEQVEHADSDSLFVTDVRNTQLQSKIGQCVDTFLAGLVLSELKGKMPDEKSEARLGEALAKVIRKIERNQKQDGTFAGNNGWASILSQGLCSKALNRAKQSGAAVSKQTLARDYTQALAAVEADRAEVAAPGAGVAGPGPGVAYARAARPTATGAGSLRLDAYGGTGGRGGKATSGPSDAGVKLYSQSANAGRIQELAESSRKQKKAAEEVLKSPSASPDAKKEARTELATIRGVEAAHHRSTDEIIKKLDDKQFVSGFGNNGGEEFLSYMNISENLVGRGGPEWHRWNKSVSQAINRVQNQDGSWSGHHCITGRTFCTSAALLTLMADRAPKPIAEKITSPKQN